MDGYVILVVRHLKDRFFEDETSMNAIQDGL